MKKNEKNRNFQDIFRNAVINDDLKKYQTDPVILKKAAQAIEILEKVKNLSLLKA